MKDKVFKREKQTVKTELTTGETKTETKTETEEIINQETLCANIENLSSSLASLSDIDMTLFGSDYIEKVYETKVNMIDALLNMSKHLTTDENT